MNETKKNLLKEMAAKIRLGALECVFNANSGHPGGSLSIADLMSYLYFEKMNIETRKRFIELPIATLCPQIKDWI